MSGLLYFCSDDFNITKGTKGNILSHGVQGISLVLFYSTDCVHCQSLIPVFKRLPGTIGSCQFGMLNVSLNKKCIMMSNNTISPIEYVPYIILYVNGRPFLKYEGPHDPSEITRFVLEVSKKLQNKQKFTSQHIKQNSNTGIPAYSIAHPKTNKVCYLEFDEAYTK